MIGGFCRNPEGKNCTFLTFRRHLRRSTQETKPQEKNKENLRYFDSLMWTAKRDSLADKENILKQVEVATQCVLRGGERYQGVWKGVIKRSTSRERAHKEQQQLLQHDREVFP